MTQNTKENHNSEVLLELENSLISGGYYVNNPWS